MKNESSGKLIFDRSTFLNSCGDTNPKTDEQVQIRKALQGNRDIYTTDVKGKIVSRFKRSNGAWMEEFIND